LFCLLLAGAVTAPLWGGGAWTGWLWGGVIGLLVALLVLRWISLARERRSPKFL
jgi:hypothetical protein